VDPDFAAYERLMPSDPKPDAILGMWRHKYPGGMQGASRSIFFKADGPFYFHGSNGNPNADCTTTGTWKYEDGGWWTGHTLDVNMPVPSRFRCDGKCLFQYSTDFRWVHFRPDGNQTRLNEWLLSSA
jgi:hypothetical protein